MTTPSRNKQFLQEVPTAQYCSSFYSKSLQHTCVTHLKLKTLMGPKPPSIHALLVHQTSKARPNYA